MKDKIPELRDNNAFIKVNTSISTLIREVLDWSPLPKRSSSLKSLEVIFSS